MLYELLERTAPGPMVTLGRAVALAMARGPAAGLAVVDELERSGELARHHRLHSVRAHLLEEAGERTAARESFRLAATLTTSVPERDYLRRKARDLAPS